MIISQVTQRMQRCILQQSPPPIFPEMNHKCSRGNERFIDKCRPDADDADDRVAIKHAFELAHTNTCLSPDTGSRNLYNDISPF